MARRRKNTGDFYLKNENLLIYINDSKKSFCDFEDQIYSDFDVIINEGDEITDQMVQDGKVARATRINDIQGNKLFKGGMTNKEVDEWIQENGIKPEEFEDNQVVFRIMTDQHIPDTTNKKGDTIKEKTNFPPFQHVIVDQGQSRVVGWSHMKNGEFSIDHGRINERLGRSHLRLVERYGRKWNWRNYSWLEEMKGQALVRLSTVGLQFDESKSSNPFAYYTMVVERTFMHVLQNEKKQLNVKRKVIESDPNLELNITFGEQAERELAQEQGNYDEEGKLKKSKHNYRVSGKSLSQIQAEKEKEDENTEIEESTND